MVFRNRFFSSSRGNKSSSADSSSPDGSNSPRTPTSSASSPSPSPSSSASRSDKKKGKSETAKKEKHGKLISSAASAVSTPSNSPYGKDGVVGGGGGGAQLSPILASSLGLNRIKTRSGPLPLPQEGRMSAVIGGSNLSRGQVNSGGGCSSSGLVSSSSSVAGRRGGKVGGEVDGRSSWAETGSKGKGKTTPEVALRSGDLKSMGKAGNCSFFGSYGWRTINLVTSTILPIRTSCSPCFFDILA